MRTVEIPEPIGEVFCHQHHNGTVEHHETPWEGHTAQCRYCGVKAVVSTMCLDKFLKSEELMAQLAYEP